MKNLSLWNVAVRKFNTNPGDKFRMCFIRDEENSCCFHTCSEYNLLVKGFDEDTKERWSAPLGRASQGNALMDFTYLPVSSQLCVGLGNGEVYTLGREGATLETPGHFDNGLVAMGWSPDQDLVVVVSDTMVATLMSCHFDPIFEANLLDEEFGEKQFVTVNWGKKETQFHGREGKQAREQSQITADEEADETVKITWRGDGNFYAIGFKYNGLRRFKVFDKEGHLQYTSEKQKGLEANLSWRPSGEVIATTQRLYDEYVVAFFEKNGLKHGGFPIPVNSTTDVEDLLWSADSEVLTLKCKDKKNGSQKLLLFTTSNYHWYLKQTILFPEEQEISDVQWDNEFDLPNIKKLHIFLCNGELYSYTWVWNIDHSRGQNDDDDAVVSVIDGRKILLTNFRQNVVPPPMAALEIELDSYVNSVHFSPKYYERANAFFVITTDHKLILYEQTEKFPLKYVQTQTIELEQYKFPFQYYNWLWVNSNTIVCITVNNREHSIIEYAIENCKVVHKNMCSLPGEAFRLDSHPMTPSEVFIQISDGDIGKYTLGGDFEPEDVTFGVPCSRFNAFSINNEVHFVAISYRGRLHIDDMMAMPGVTSYFVHSHFLLVTNNRHFLFCVQLTGAGLKAIKQYSMDCDNPNINKRKIERGGILVIAVPNDIRTVLQMPRGNLETIQPRPLSLIIIGKYLDDFKYKEAFDLMRKQRINLNLFYDHNPEKFTQNIEKFLESIDNNSWLSLFLSDLENVDVTRTMYSSSYAERQDVPVGYLHTPNKVLNVCNLVRLHLCSRPDIDSRILPLITSFVKTTSLEDIEEALVLIKELKLKEEKGAKLPVGSDEAIKYLLYMVDVNKLFDISLGIYDFDLVLLVANKSQKDPKEYIPMLKELKVMEENYRKFTINKHLKRFDKAVQSLVQCGPELHTELKAFVKYHSLYRESLNLFTPDQEIYKQISEDFGSYLRLRKQFVEAGIVYERGSNFDKAIECYKDALEWELAINLAQSWPKDQFQQLCSDLVRGLKEEKRHKEVLTILETYYADKDEGIRYAIENGQFKTAIRLCSQYKKNVLKESSILPAVIEEWKNLQELVETNLTTFNRHKNRLRFVREFKAKTPIDIHDTFANNECDLYSDAGSTVASSRGSTRSYRSSKNRRKHERKVASLKEGSRYEDVALVMAVHSLVTSSFDLRTQVREVNIALNYFGKHKEAFVLQTSLEKLLKEMKDSLKEIWTNQFVLEATNATIAAENVPEGGQAIIPEGIASLEPHIRIAPVIPDVNWKLEGLY